MSQVAVAAEAGDWELVKQLVESRADPRCCNSWGATPLHWAARAGAAPHTIRTPHPPTAAAEGCDTELLINAGANVRARDDYGEDPSSWARSNGKPLQLICPTDRSLRMVLRATRHTTGARRSMQLSCWDRSETLSSPRAGVQSFRSQPRRQGATARAVCTGGGSEGSRAAGGELDRAEEQDFDGSGNLAAPYGPTDSQAVD